MISCASFYASEPLRQELHARSPRLPQDLAQKLGQGIDRVDLDLALLQTAGAVRPVEVKIVNGRLRRSDLEPLFAYELTETGVRMLGWAAPPSGSSGGEYAGEILRALAYHHAISIAEILSSTVGVAVVARARLCYALHARGWPYERIDSHLRLERGRAESGVSRWRRIISRKKEPRHAQRLQESC